MVIAATFAQGRLSPDVDQRGIPAKLIPGGHRGITHWPIALAAVTAAVVTIVPDPWQWPARAVLAGWVSHLAVDFLWGELPVWPKRGKGWHRAGLGLDTGGRLEALATPALWIATAAVTVLAITGCGGQPDAGIVAGKRTDLGHFEAKKKCASKVSGKCRRWKTAQEWDDTDYELLIGRADGSQEWVDVEQDVYDRTQVGGRWGE
jgi:hypothetical protein